MPPLELAKHKAGWIKSFDSGFSQDENSQPIPWMTYGAIEFLQSKLKSSQQVFEFGCGASTLFFATKVSKVISLETNPRWLKIIQEKLAEIKLHNATITLMADGLTNSNYENFLQTHTQEFDFIIIDSLKRHQCAINCLKALKPGGIIVLDDSQRKNYQKTFEFFAANQFQQLDFPGIAPGQLVKKNTTFFFK